jgi:clan AA aspartic protease
MMTGTVNAFREAVLRLTVDGPDGDRQEVEAIVDTGFDGHLTLPAQLVAALKLPFATRATTMLGDGSTIVFDVHVGTVLWNGRQRQILVEVSDTEPLLGMRMMESHELTIEVIDGGALSIRELLYS